MTSLPSSDPRIDRGRPILAPGVRIVAAGLDQLQIGLDAGKAVRLPGSAKARHVLERLRVGSALPDDAETQALLEILEERQLVVRRGERTLAPILVEHRGAFPVDPAELLTASGLRSTTGPRTDADVVLLTGVGELPRAEVDALTRAGAPHLILRLFDGVALLGPFVEPGSSACLRCIDAHHEVDQPGYRHLVERYTRASTAARPDGLEEPPDRTLATLALAWAVRDLATYAGGRRPSTWSTTLRITPEPVEVVAVSWLRDPRCGCAWSAG